MALKRLEIGIKQNGIGSLFTLPCFDFWNFEGERIFSRRQQAWLARPLHNKRGLSKNSTSTEEFLGTTIKAVKLQAIIISCETDFIKESETFRKQNGD